MPDRPPMNGGFQDSLASSAINTRLHLDCFVDASLAQTSTSPMYSGWAVYQSNINIDIASILQNIYAMRFLLNNH